MTRIRISNAKRAVLNGQSLPDYLDHESLAAAAVELTVEDLLPRAEVEIAVGDGDHHFSTHDLAFVVRITVVFSRSVVMIPFGTAIKRRQPFQPPLVIFVQPVLVIVDEDAGGDVHCVHQTEAFLHTAGPDFLADIVGDVDEGSTTRHVESEVLGM